MALRRTARWPECDLFLDRFQYHSLETGTLLVGAGLQDLEYRFR